MCLKAEAEALILWKHIPLDRQQLLQLSRRGHFTQPQLAPARQKSHGAKE